MELKERKVKQGSPRRVDMQKAIALLQEHLDSVTAMLQKSIDDLEYSFPELDEDRDLYRCLSEAADLATCDYPAREHEQAMREAGAFLDCLYVCNGSSFLKFWAERASEFIRGDEEERGESPDQYTKVRDKHALLIKNCIANFHGELDGLYEKYRKAEDVAGKKYGR